MDIGGGGKILISAKPEACSRIHRGSHVVGVVDDAKMATIMEEQ